MNDSKKTRAQLLSELTECRQRLAQLGAGRSQVEPSCHERLLEAVFEQATDAMFVKDIEGRYLVINAIGAAMLGRRPEDIVGRDDTEIFPASDAATIRALDLGVMESGVPFCDEESAVFNGDRRMVFTTKAPYHDDAGKVIGLIGIARDITERKKIEGDLVEHRERLENLVKARTAEMERANRVLEREIAERDRAEEEVRRNEERYRHLFDEAPVGYHELDAKGRITRVNKTELDMLGYSSEEMVGHFAWEFVVEEDVSRDALQRKLRGDVQPGQGFERTFRCSNAGRLPVMMEDSLIHDADGAIAGIRTTMQDITERKRAEEERIELERQVQHVQKLESLGVLAGGIAHDFNNLLMGILGNADLALDDLPPGSPVRPSILEIETSAKRAADLARQMLAYSGKGRFVVEPIALADVVEEMTHLLEVSISKNCVLKYHFSPNIPAVEADVTQVRQIIMNLIINASEAIEERSGVITVTTGAMECDREYLSETYLDERLPEGVYVYLEVADTGCGMSAETAHRIFDPFFTSKFTGRGLGLAAVLGIVRGHKGAIKVYSEPRRGSTFKVLFPALDFVAEKAHGEAESDKAWRGTGAILLVDDDDSVRAVGRRMLERQGFTVLTAEDGRQALTQFDEHANDIVCVILDLTMPHLDGEETFRHLRQRKRSVCVLLSSGYNEQEVVNRFAGKGLAGFIQKPYQARDLIAKLREVLGA